MRRVSFSEHEIIQILGPHLNVPFVFFETSCADRENKKSLLFTDFDKTITFSSTGNPNRFFNAIEKYRAQGFWIAGYFAYEFGYWLDPAFKDLQKKSESPLAWFALCRNPRVFTHKISNSKRHAVKEGYSRGTYAISCMHPHITKKEFCAQIHKIKKYLEQGLTYQVNFTFQMHFNFSGDALALYLNLRRAQPTAYMAFMNTGTQYILSLSPELFFRQKGKTILGRPMKGTSPRGFVAAEDSEQETWLRKSEKIKAENVMIVDLLRNDLGRVASHVTVPELFAIEKYRTLYQMTSTISAQLKKATTFKDIVTALFPCGSVTGAPKIKTMHLIAQLEKEERGVYTGSIGYFSPRNEAVFNIAIRTVTIEENRGRLGIGGGIVYDSCPESEYKEALLKGKFLLEEFPVFSLIETLRLEEGEYFLLDLHLKRLERSCAYFAIPCDVRLVRSFLRSVAVANANGTHRVRLLMDMEGEISVSAQILEVITEPVSVAFSDERVNPQNLFLYHKTTQRKCYNRLSAEAKRQGLFDFIFCNTHGEITEGCISSVFVESGGTLFTPPLAAGLLPGVLRQHLLTKKRVQERALCVTDVLCADAVFVGNSVRGLLKASVVDCKNVAPCGTMEAR